MRASRAVISAALLAGSALACLASPVSAQSAEASGQRTFNIPAQPLADAIMAYGAQSGVQVTASADLVAGRTASAISGKLAPAEALSRLLIGTGLTFRFIRPNVVTLELAPKSAEGSIQLGPVRVEGASGSGSGYSASLTSDPAATEGTGSYTNSVTSTATKMNLSIRETPQSISVVTRQRMDDQNLTSITNVLEQTPGITITRDTGERLIIQSRGQEITKYQFDGLTTHSENGTQNLAQTFTDMSIYDRIEVVRGATGLMTGAGVPSGVVNMIRKRPTKEFQASLTGSVGRWDEYRGLIDISGPLINNGKLRARFVAAKQDNDSFTDNYEQSRDILYGVVEGDVTGSTTVRVGIDYQKYEANGGTGVPLLYSDGTQTSFSRSSTVVSKNMDESIQTTNYFFNIDQSLPRDWKIVVAGNYMDGSRDVYDALRMQSNIGRTVNILTGNYTVTGSDYFGADQNQQSFAINAQGPFSLFGRTHQLIFGYEYSRYENDHSSYGIIYSGTSNIEDPSAVTITSITWPNRGERYLHQIFTVKQQGFHGSLRINPFNNLHIITGTRLSYYKYDYIYSTASSSSLYLTNYEASGKLTPYVGLVYDLTPQQSVYASYTDIFTPNNVIDINGKILDPQVGANYEIGWKGEFYDGRLNANVAIYRVKRDNTAQLAGYDSSNIPYYRTISGMKTKGIDIEVAGEVLPGWNVSGSYSYSRSEDSDGTRQTPENPLNTIRLWNTYKFSGDWEGLSIGGGARWSSQTYSTPYTNSSGVYLKAVQDPYVVFDLMAGYRLNDSFSAKLNISNLLDKTYYSHLGNLGYGYYGEPRNARLTVQYSF